MLVLLQKLDDLEADLSGPSRLRAGVRRPTILVVGATSTPDDLRSLAGELAEKTAGLLRLVDARLSGTPAAAACGGLSIVVGAAPGLYRDSLPVLELLGTCVRVGSLGSAQIANACEQYVIAATAMALSEAAVIVERAGLDLSRVLQSWELSLAGSRVLEAARGKLANRDFQPDTTGWACIGATRSRDAAGMADGHFSPAAGKRPGTLGAVGSSWAKQSGPDVHVPVSGRTAPRAPRSTGLVGRRSGCERAWEGRARAGSHLRASPARGLCASGELKNHDHQDDDHQDTDDGSDNSPVHGQDLLSSLGGTRGLRT